MEWNGMNRENARRKRERERIYVYVLENTKCDVNKYIGKIPCITWNDTLGKVHVSRWMKSNIYIRNVILTFFLLRFFLIIQKLPT